MTSFDIFVCCDCCDGDLVWRKRDEKRCLLLISGDKTIASYNPCRDEDEDAGTQFSLTSLGATQSRPSTSDGNTYYKARAKYNAPCKPGLEESPSSLPINSKQDQHTVVSTKGNYYEQKSVTTASWMLVSIVCLYYRLSVFLVFNLSWSG